MTKLLFQILHIVRDDNNNVLMTVILIELFVVQEQTNIWS